MLIGGAALVSLFVEHRLWGEPWPHVRAMMFTVLVMGHLLYAFVVHSSGRRNAWLYLGVGGGARCRS